MREAERVITARICTGGKGEDEDWRGKWEGNQVYACKKRKIN